MSPKSPDFDWVSARHDCTAGRIFNDLRELAQVNVETRNEQIQGRSETAIDFRQSPPGTDPPTFTVLRHRSGSASPYMVRFRLEKGLIRVESERLVEPVGFDVTVRMDDDGRCVCFVDDQRRLPWQILHRALDPLLFGHHPVFG